MYDSTERFLSAEDKFAQRDHSMEIDRLEARIIELEKQQAQILDAYETFTRSMLQVLQSINSKAPY